MEDWKKLKKRKWKFHCWMKLNHMQRKRNIIIICLIFCILVILFVRETGKDDDTGRVSKATEVDDDTGRISKATEADDDNDISLEWGYVTQEDINRIADFGNLEKLVFSIFDNEDLDLSPLINLERLEELDIYTIDCNNLDTAPLAELKHLKKMHIEGNSYNLNLSFLSELNQLEEIHIHQRIDNLAVFKNMHELKEIYLEFVGDTDLSYFRELNKLEKIHIVGSDVRNLE